MSVSGPPGRRRVRRGDFRRPRVHRTRGAAAVPADVARPANAAAEPLEEVIVTASLRRDRLADLPASVTVLDAATVAAAGVQHLQDLLPLVPNLNWASGSSRPRYFQLRGIGETEQ